MWEVNLKKNGLKKTPNATDVDHIRSLGVPVHVSTRTLFSNVNMFVQTIKARSTQTRRG